MSQRRIENLNRNEQMQGEAKWMNETESKWNKKSEAGESVS